MKYTKHINNKYSLVLLQHKIKKLKDWKPLTSGGKGKLLGKKYGNGHS